MTESIKAKMHMLHTCPFCWKVRSIAEHLDIDYEKVQVYAYMYILGLNDSRLVECYKQNKTCDIID